MNPTKKFVWISFQPLVLISLVALTGCTSDNVVSAIIERQIKANVTPEYVHDKENIVVVTVGTASPIPGERAQTGTAIFVNDYFFMFDVGAGVVQKSENMRLPLNELDGIFLTHFHSDHMIDLPNLINRSWLLGRKNELHIYGPDSLNTLVQAANDFLALENKYRVNHHGLDIMDISKAKGVPHEYHIPQNSKAVIFQQDGITITAFDVAHEPIEPAVGYAIEYKGKKVVLSGDTKRNDLVAEMAQGCDLLVHEVMLMSFQQLLEAELTKAGMDRTAKIIFDIQDYHTDTKEIAELAKNSNVKKLVINHLAPIPDNRILKKLYLEELKAFEGPIHFANDGDIFIVKGEIR
ncbi:MAG: MBL fold metallo-hydrolase [Saprospiraceae bacterium]|nr:MBL fold metallo-hydrolase [Saprospiraceae bacterium]MDP4999373.1 MBL fold metallo-hydrolase [Saprospiraceae bacterium]